MATLSFGQLGNASGGAITAKSLGPIDLPANCLVFIDVLTRHTTSASLQTPTLAGTGGETWVAVGTPVDNAPTSPGIRVTRFRTMVATKTTTTVTATCTVAQTEIDVQGMWCGGVDTSGTHGSGACGASQIQNSNGSNVTSASKSLGSPAHPRNGFVATCRAPSGAMGSRTGWTEVYDSAGGGSYGQVQVQAIDKPDGTWSMTCSSGTYAVIITEVIAAPTPAIIRALVTSYQGTISSGSFSFSGVAGCTYLLLTRANSGTITPSTPGLTWTVEYNPSGGFKVWKARVTARAEYLVTMTLSGSLSEVGWGLMEVQCDDSVYPWGIIQSVNAVSQSSPYAPTIAAPLSRASSMFMFLSGSATYPTVQPGWQQAPRTLDNLFYGATFISTGHFRANSDPAPSIVLSSGTLGFFWFAEFAGIANCACESEGDPPEFDLVSPPEGEIEPTDEIIIDVTDPDDDLSKVVFGLLLPTLGLTEEIWDGDSFRAPWATSEVEDITDGKRFTFRRTGGIPDTSITLEGLAYDENGNDATGSWTWSIDFGTDEEDDGDETTTSGSPSERGRDIEIDPVTNDIVLTSDGDLSIIGGVPSIVQDIRQTVLQFFGEWFLDETVGVPWFDNILVKNPNLPAIRAIFREAISDVAGVLDVVRVDVNLDKSSRVASITFTVTTDVGELVETIAIPGRATGPEL